MGSSRSGEDLDVVMSDEVDSVGLTGASFGEVAGGDERERRRRSSIIFMASLSLSYSESSCLRCDDDVTAGDALPLRLIVS